MHSLLARLLCLLVLFQCWTSADADDENFSSIEDNTSGTATVMLSNGVSVDMLYREGSISAHYPRYGTDNLELGELSDPVSFSWSMKSHCSADDSEKILKTPGLIIQRGQCSFSDKLSRAALAGATHVLIIDTENASHTKTSSTSPHRDIFPIMGDIWHGTGPTGVAPQPWVASVAHKSWEDVVFHTRLSQNIGDHREAKDVETTFNISFKSKYYEEESKAPILECLRRVDELLEIGHHNSVLRSFSTHCFGAVLKHLKATIEAQQHSNEHSSTHESLQLEPSIDDENVARDSSQQSKIKISFPPGYHYIHRALKAYTSLDTCGATAARKYLLQWCYLTIMNTYPVLSEMLASSPLPSREQQHKQQSSLRHPKDSMSLDKYTFAVNTIRNIEKTQIMTMQVVDLLILQGSVVESRSLLEKLLLIDWSVKKRLSNQIIDFFRAEYMSQKHEDGNVEGNNDQVNFDANDNDKNTSEGVGTVVHRACTTELLLEMTTLLPPPSSSNAPTWAVSDRNMKDSIATGGAGGVTAGLLRLCPNEVFESMNLRNKLWTENPLLWMSADYASVLVQKYGHQILLRYVKSIIEGNTEIVNRNTKTRPNEFETGMKQYMRILHTHTVTTANTISGTRTSAGLGHAGDHEISARAQQALLTFVSRSAAATEDAAARTNIHHKTSHFVVPSELSSSEEELTQFVQLMNKFHQSSIVFLDEFGDLGSSQRHHLQYLAGYKWIMPRQDIQMLKLSLAKKLPKATGFKGVKSLKALRKKKGTLTEKEQNQLSQAEYLEKLPYQNILTFITGCAFQRALLATPPVQKSTSHYRIHTKSQLQKLKELKTVVEQSRLALTSQLSELEKENVLSHVFSMLQNATVITNTPASMMVGYNSLSPVNVANGEMDTSHDILRLANEISYQMCLNPFPEAPAAKERQEHLDSAAAGTGQRQMDNEKSLKVGFIGSFFYDHTVGKLLKQVLGQLNGRRITDLTTDATGSGNRDDARRIETSIISIDGMLSMDVATFKKRPKKSKAEPQQERSHSDSENSMVEESVVDYDDAVTRSIAATAGKWQAFPYPAQKGEGRNLGIPTRLFCRSNNVECSDEEVRKLGEDYPALITPMTSSSPQFIKSRTRSRLDLIKSHRYSQQFISQLSQWIRQQSFDVLVYPEIGMDSLTLALASKRLTKENGKQAAFWGHPISQGLNSIDYYISSELYEESIIASNSARRNKNVKGDQSDYHTLRKRSEQVVLFSGLTMFPQKPKLMLKTLKQLKAPLRENEKGFDFFGRLGLGPDLMNNRNSRIYLLPHTIMKYSTIFDEVLTGILRDDSSAIMLLIGNDQQQHWVHKLYSRLITDNSSNESNTDIGSRLILLPKLNQKEYFSVLSAVDVVLDSIPFGMGLTAIECFAAGIPVITLPSMQSVPELAAGMIRIMDRENAGSGLPLSPRLIAHSIQEYVQLAVAAAGKGDGADYRNQLRDDLSKFSKVIFDRLKENTSTSAVHLNDWVTWLFSL